MTKTRAPTLREFQDRFPTEEACLDHLFQVRYGADFDCPGCGREARYSRVAKRRSYQCQWCAHQIYPTAGTPFERTRTPLRDWFFVMFQFCASRNGVAAKEVERQLGVTYKTAWRMCHEIRKYMGEVDGSGPIGGDGKIVQLDETFVGGRFDRGKRGGDPAEGKAIVFGMLECGGAVVTALVPNRTRGTLFPLVKATVAPRSLLHTDEYRTYITVGNMAGMAYTHEAVNHRMGEYVCRRTGATVNALEGFWASLKRGINGTHIHVSSKHLPKYLGEFEYRWNMRQMPHLMLPRLMASFAR
ncbi:IS1595 family transposase [Sphingomonas sp.]|uniref:IS1595 family transposase n=1 Tax=Sphingomonas sp. TaxID=28214 RepID=UPI001B1B9347|nr:IS1595 family transposase [Sphingomonas sp.]MBO9713218.1 IS1595 family transposase [Sphingomonas sp.]